MISEELCYLWLAAANIPSKKQTVILEHYSPTELFNSFGELSFIKSFLTDAAYEKLKRFRDETFLENSVKAFKKRGINFITIKDNCYSECLNQYEVDPPKVLFYMGDISLLKTDCIAVVGTRASSKYGKEVTGKFVRDFSQNGLTVVSGLATGIDGYAHSETLKCGGKTIAVMGGGHLHMTPVSNINLFNQICENGLVISEYPPETSPGKFTFPERNRIISGLSRAVVVIEAGLKSGSLITASFAAEQGRDVFAVPGNINSSKSEGTNALLRTGAFVATSSADIFDKLDINYNNKNKENVPFALDNYQQMIYNLLQGEFFSVDELVDKTKIPPSEIVSALLGMELLGILEKKQSNKYGLK